jgi:PTS system mannose-specific IIA component
MVRFLIATHGFLADGFKSSINVLMGEEIADKIDTINAFIEGGTDNPKAEIEKYCSELKQDDDLIIITDLMYGSVNQFALPYAENKNIHIISGANFPLICEIISKLTFGSEEVEDKASVINEAIEKAREQIIYAKNLDSKEEDNEEDFFQ